MPFFLVFLGTLFKMATLIKIMLNTNSRGILLKIRC